MSPRGICLWVFENETQVWELRKEVDIEVIKQAMNFPTPGGVYNADIALMMGYSKVIFYKLHNKSFNTVNLNKCRAVREIFPFRSDLEPVDPRMQGENNIVSSKKQPYSLFWISLFHFCFILIFGLLDFLI